MKKIVIVLQEAASDIERGIDFYNAIEDGVGLYFRLFSKICGWFWAREGHQVDGIGRLANDGSS